MSGVTGLIGKTLADRLVRDGHEVVGLTRRRVPGMVTWEPARGVIDRDSLGHIDAIVHLAGESIEGRWTARKRKAITESRLSSTDLLARLATRVKPKVFVSGSAIGFYGDRGDEVLTEQSPPGRGFLADLVERWEGAAAPAREAGVRTVFARTGLVLSVDGGSLPPLLRIFKTGGGGRLGPGTQYWSWISLEDEVGALRFLIENDALEGPVNLVGPDPVTNARFTEVLAKTLHRPAVLPVPATALRLALGTDFANELLLASQRVIPAALEGAGFEFRHAELISALSAIV